MKTLRVGDLHVKVSNLDESEKLMQFILHKAQELKVDQLELTGDLTDTHDIVRLRVQEFWHRWFKILSQKPFKTIVLSGNHDMVGDYNSEYSSLSVYKEIQNLLPGTGIKIVDEPYLDGKYGYLPYIHNDEKFIEEANKLANQGATVLVSHPNFKGAVYDNGHSIDNGVDPDRLSDNFHHLVGGHIHSEAVLGRVWYIGTPRWLTKSCANKPKGIWLCEHDDSGKMTSKEFISTHEVCTPIVSVQWKEGEDKPEVPKNSKIDIELVGSSDWVSKVKKELVGVSISSKLTDTKKSRERKSGKSLFEFISKYYQIDAKKREKLIQYLKDNDLV